MNSLRGDKIQGISAKFFFHLDYSSHWLSPFPKLFSWFRVLYFSTCSCFIKSVSVLLSKVKWNVSNTILVVFSLFFTKVNENPQLFFVKCSLLYRKLRIHRIVWASDVGRQGHTEERSISWSTMHAVQVSHAWRRHWFFINLQARITDVEREW